MISPLFLSRFALAAALFCAVAPGSILADDVTPPVVSVPLSDLTFPVNSGAAVVNLKKTFALTGVTGKLVRFSTTVGNIDVELLADAAPKTVQTFLQYARASGDNTTGVYSYTNTLLQRAVPNFILQGGGFYISSSGQLNQIVGRPAIPSEAGVKNTRGTLAMALSSGPESATGDFFFNVIDNAILDGTADGGPFTVFGKCIGTLATLDLLDYESATIKIRDLSQDLGAAFASVPLINYDPVKGAQIDNLIYLKSVTNLPLTPKVQGGVAALKLKVKSNTNPGLVQTSLVGRSLTLTFTPDATGTATITLLAKNTTTKSKVTTSFIVTVEPQR